MEEKLGHGTRAAHSGDQPDRFLGAVSPPIFEASLFTYPDFDALGAGLRRERGTYVYTRVSNPTIELAEAKLAALEEAEAALFFSSGMAAISSVILAHVKQGDHVVCVRSAYGVTRALLNGWLPKFGVTTSYVDGKDPQAVREAIRPETRVIYLESPTSLTFELQDIEQIAMYARQSGVVTMVDNSWAGPIFQRPLALGADYSIHTASKYIGGHSDVVAGAVLGSSEAIDRLRQSERSILGGVIGPFEAWLCLRGMRTLPLRLRRHEASSLAVAAHLESHPKVRRVIHPGLSSHPQHALAARQTTGSGGLFAIELDTDLAGVRRFTNALKHFLIGISWGGFESLVFPAGAFQGKAADPGSAPLPVGHVRLFVGLEDIEDLTADLDQALKHI